MRLFWHQRDLRARDNRGLARAAADGAALPVYVHAPAIGAVGDRQRAFRAACARKLRETYRDRGSDLVVRTGDPADLLPRIAAEYGADGVVYNEGYAAERRDRERRVEAACEEAGLETHTETDLVLVDPADLEPQYRTHSQFHRDWETAPKPGPAPTPPSDSLADATDDRPVPTVETDLELPPAGYRPARDRLDGFLEAGIDSYADTRDDLELAVEAPTGAVSRLSPYLAVGAIGIREVWADATDACENATGDERRNVEKYRYELSWREQNYHLLYYNPDLRTENYEPFPEGMAWRNDDEAFAAWTAGETGYPLVDAGMRQLRREGYVHNRPRQVVASFLTKHLLVDWRRGERFFADRLLDFDPANNGGNWQWIASTGTDSVDVRIFDPVSQMDKYDPDAAFVAEYVPELRGVPADRVVEWPTLRHSQREQLAPEYHHPIVDRDHAYERAQRVYESALGKR